MKWNFFIKYIFGVLLLFSFLGTYTHAQNINIYDEDDVFVEVNPKIPGPNENVRLKLNSYSFNLNNYYIAWFEDGQRVASGFGQKEFEFRTGDSGTITEVTAVVEYENQIFRKELVFSPSQIDMLWEVIDGYTPPFYKGKTIPLTQSQVRVSAIPETFLIEPADAPNLVYYWDRNYKRQGFFSGFGKMFYEFTIDPLINNERITVTSNDRRENSFASNTITIETEENTPKILFYEINEFGRLLTQKALNTHRIINKDTIKFAFQPLFISSIQPNLIDLFINWKINDISQEPQDFSKQNELYISSNGENGLVNIGVEVEGIDKLLQIASEGINLSFNLNE